jgi:hypothetical protein
MSAFTVAQLRRRLVQAFGRNPLVRMSDRVEAVVMVLVIAAALAGIPVAGAVGTAVYHERGRACAEQASTRHMVGATAIGDSTAVPHPRTTVIVVHALWRAGGSDHVAALNVDHPVKGGELVGVWVNQYGDRVPSPIPSWRAGADAVVAAAAVWLAATAVIAVLFGALHAWLDRLRYAGWDRDITSLADNGGGRPTRRHDC